MTETARSQITQFAGCIGRFRFSLDSSLVTTGRSQRIYRVNVGTISVGDGNAMRIWEDRLTAIRAIQRPATVPDPIIRIFDLDTGTRAVWFHADSTDLSFVTLETMKPYNDHVLNLVREVAAGSEAVTEKMYRRVIAGYEPHGRRGFCVGSGALVSETSKNEQTLISWARPSLGDYNLSLATNTVDRPEGGDGLEDIHEERKVLMESGSEVVVDHNERRVVAGLTGTDARIQLQARGQLPIVRFTWRFGGVGSNPSAPQIVIVGTAPANQKSQLTQDWEMLLQSLQPLPPPQ